MNASEQRFINQKKKIELEIVMVRNIALLPEFTSPLFQLTLFCSDQIIPNDLIVPKYSHREYFIVVCDLSAL